MSTENYHLLQKPEYETVAAGIWFAVALLASLIKS